MDNFDLKKYLAEGKLLKEGMSLEFYDGDVELIADSGDYVAEIEDNGKVSFSVVYEDEDDREGMEFDEDNWKSILGSKHAFVEIASKIPTEVEAIDDYVMITVNLEDLKGIVSLAEGKLLKENEEQYPIGTKFYKPDGNQIITILGYEGGKVMIQATIKGEREGSGFKHKWPAESLQDIIKSDRMEVIK